MHGGALGYHFFKTAGIRQRRTISKPASKRPDHPTSIVAPNRNLRTTISPNRNVDVGQQPQRRPAGRCRSVGVGARWIGAASRARVGAARRVNAVAACPCCCDPVLAKLTAYLRRRGHRRRRQPICQKEIPGGPAQSSGRIRRGARLRLARA
jgi:hypothetical protein